MTPRQFDMMDEMEQIKVIAHQDEDVVEREDESFLYKLYPVDSFFIEEKIQKPLTFFSKSHFNTNLN